MSRLPPESRPRERLARVGAEALSDAELLALVLMSGRPGESALDLATGLLAEYGGLRRLGQARPEELGRKPGVGAAKAAALVAAFHLGRRTGEAADVAPVLAGSDDVAAAARPMLADARRERVLVLICDAQHRLRRHAIIAEGALDRSPILVREVLNAVLRHDGRAFAVAHNHPSGDPTPSLADRRATAALIEAARTVGLQFLDHVIVAGDRHASATRPPQTPR